MRAWSAEPPRNFQSEIYGFTAEYPADWFAGPATDGRLEITDFPPSQAVHGVYVPDKGAMIWMAPAESQAGRGTPQTMEAWIEMNTRRQDVISRLTVNLPSSRGQIAATEIAIRYEDERSLEWYFQFGSRLFEASLIYWVDNDHVDSLVETMRQIVASLRLIPRDPAPKATTGTAPKLPSDYVSSFYAGDPASWPIFVSKAGWTLRHPKASLIEVCFACKDPTDANVGWVGFSDPDNATGVMVETFRDQPDGESETEWLTWLRDWKGTPIEESEWFLLNGARALRVKRRDNRLDASEEVFVVAGGKTFHVVVSGGESAWKMAGTFLIVSP
jgi:hypothetical protein